MELTITAVGPDHMGLADPIIHYVTGCGANVAEIQMYDHDKLALFAMLLRIQLPQGSFQGVRQGLQEIGRRKGLSVRVWSPELHRERPHLAICTTYRPEPALALLTAVRDGVVPARVVLMAGNRKACRRLADAFDVPWYDIGDERGNPDDDRLTELLDEHDVDYLVLARYMRILPAAVCWKFAGGRIVNLHHGLLPSFPGIHPYQDAYSARMLTFGATCHFIVPELDAGNQIIHQSTFTVPPGTRMEEVIRRGQEENEPKCLVEGVRRVVTREVQLHFHRVIARDE